MTNRRVTISITDSSRKPRGWWKNFREVSGLTNHKHKSGTAKGLGSIETSREALKRIKPEVTNCGICGKEIRGQGINFDHDHRTGLFRGWLCRDCNCKLGWIETLEEWLPIFGEAVKKYLNTAQRPLSIEGNSK